MAHRAPDVGQEQHICIFIHIEFNPPLDAPDTSHKLQTSLPPVPPSIDIKCATVPYRLATQSTGNDIKPPEQHTLCVTPNTVGSLRRPFAGV